MGRENNLKRGVIDDENECEIGFNLAEAECECEAGASAQLPHVRKIDINVKHRTKFRWEKKDMMGKATEVVCECEHSFD